MSNVQGPLSPSLPLMLLPALCPVPSTLHPSTASTAPQGLMVLDGKYLSVDERTEGCMLEVDDTIPMAPALAIDKSREPKIQDLKVQPMGRGWNAPLLEGMATRALKPGWHFVHAVRSHPRTGSSAHGFSAAQFVRPVPVRGQYFLHFESLASPVCCPWRERTQLWTKTLRPRNFPVWEGHFGPNIPGPVSQDGERGPSPGLTAPLSAATVAFWAIFGGGG